jgi:hypothetical protein
MKKNLIVIALLAAITFAFIGCDDSDYLPPQVPFQPGVVAFNLQEYLVTNNLTTGVLTENNVELPLVLAGGPTVTISGTAPNLSLAVTNRTNSWDGIDFVPKNYLNFSVNEFSIVVTFDDETVAGLKLARAGGSYATITTTANTTNHTLTGALTSAAVGTENIRIQANANAVFIIKNIVITATKVLD